ncbi:RNA binding protein, putative [Brugia malayi]|uniref:RNA binding protein, putative n=2 Tax=Brugia TaxID=6278 RepID=A0A4E9F6Y4_BRUMA|nr:RNA binding protein, putative [Brugia malayi]VIO92040.1 RNA binding protein, putative [Brugia malayi]
MSAEVNCMTGGNSGIHHQQEEPITDGMENNVVLTTTPAAVKSISTEETDLFPETTGTNNHPVGTLCSVSGPGSGSRSQKSKKRQNQKTFSLMDIFDMHKGIGSWADAAAADAHATSYSPSTIQESPDGKQVSNAMQRASASQQGDWDQYQNTDGNMHPSLLGLDRATHSRNVDLANLPDRPPFEVKVTNINYKSSDSDLFYFFGGESNVVNIRSEGQTVRRGTAIVSLSSQEALANALKMNSMELQGRSLRISLRDHQPRPSVGGGRIPLQDHQSRLHFSSSNVGPNNAYGHYRNNGSCHEGGYNTLPHPRRGPPPVPYHAYNSDGRNNRLPLQHCSSYRGRDNRRYDYDNRLLRHPKPGNQFSPRFTNRSSADSYGISPRPSPLNENPFFHVEIENDADKRGAGRIRTESVRSSTTDGTEKHERRKLQLQPRTKPLNSTGDDLPARPTNIFGLAKPVDTYEKEKQAEERLRLENEAFKAAEQRSRKVSERAVSVPTSPLLIHGQVSVVAEPSSHDDRENLPLLVQKAVPEVNCKSLGNDEKFRTSVIPQLASNEERVKQAETPSFVDTLTSVPKLPSPPLESSIAIVRRQSFSSYPEMSETRAPTTLMRTRNSYNRTFTRSRDSVRTQFQSNKLHSIPVRRGKSGSRRGGANSGGLGSDRDKHFVVSKEKVEDDNGTSNVEPIVPNGPKQLENGPKPERQALSKEEKREFLTTTAKQQWQQQSDQQCSKREKKKQAVAAREMPKYVEQKPFTFSSENKYAALLDADD